MVGTETVLVISMVEGDFDSDGCVDQSNECCRDSNKICTSSICRTGEPRLVSDDEIQQ